jgi:AraC-like DNA-binding protein
MAEYNHINPQATGAFLKKTLLDLMPEAGSFETGIPGLRITRQNEPTKSANCFYIPMIVVMVQGSKQVFFGSEEFIYSENQCLVTGLDLPALVSIVKATRDKPCLAISLELDTYVITDLLAAIPRAKIESGSESEDFIHRGMAVTDVDPYVLDAFLRLAGLIDDKERQKVLAPMIIREIHYRLLTGPLGTQIRMINTIGSKSNRIAQAITWLRTNYNKPVNINELAKMTNMAPSTFNRYFRHLTNVSPLQYQKRLRLYEAQRLMLIENQNAGNAAVSVGYESPSQFNREYKRMFGIPPLENKKRILTG